MDKIESGSKQGEYQPEVHYEVPASPVTNSDMAVFKPDRQPAPAVSDGNFIFFGDQTELYGEEMPAENPDDSGTSDKRRSYEIINKIGNLDGTSNIDKSDKAAAATQALGRAISEGKLGKLKHTDNIKVFSIGSEAGQDHTININGEKDQVAMPDGNTAVALVNRDGKLTQFRDSKGSIDFDEKSVTIRDSDGQSTKYSVTSGGKLVGPDGDLARTLAVLNRQGLAGKMDTETMIKFGKQVYAAQEAHFRVADMYGRLGMSEKSKEYEKLAGEVAEAPDEAKYQAMGWKELQKQLDIELAIETDRKVFGLPSSATAGEVIEARRLADQDRKKVYQISEKAPYEDIVTARANHLLRVEKSAGVSIGLTRDILGIPKTIPDSEVLSIREKTINRLPI